MLAFLVCLFAADAEPVPAMKVAARGEWRQGHLNGKKAFVVRKGEDLAALQPYVNLDAPPAAVARMATTQLAEDLKVKDIDWRKQMAVVILAGMKGSGGYSVEVTGFKAEKGGLKVAWKLHEPKGAADSVITHPNTVVLVPTFAGKVEFDPPLK